MSRRYRTFTLLRNGLAGDSPPAREARFRRIATLLVALLVALAALAAVSASASSSSPSFETGTEPFTNLECAHPSTQFTRVTSPVREGAYAAKITESPTDIWSNGSVRCLATKYDSGETTGDDYYYHLSLYIPSNGITSNLLWELHHPASLYNISAGCSVAPHALVTDGTQLQYRLFAGNCNGSTYDLQTKYSIPGLNPYPRNVWIDLVIHVKFQESTTGTLEIYYRTGSNPWPSSPQVSKSGIPTMPYSNAQNVHNVKLYWEAGLYPGYSGYNSTDTIYMDDVRRETSLSAAEGGGSVETPPAPAPTPTPTPTPTTSGSAPASTSAPQVSGTLQVDQTLTTTNGAWSGSPTSYAYQWQYTRDQGATWLNVNGATGTTFQESSTFQGTLVRASVTASNGSGSTTVPSSPVGPIAAVPASATQPTPTKVTAPVNTSLPQISGTVRVGQVLTATSGVWSGSPTGYLYQWQYSRDNGATWRNVKRATATTFQESSTFQGSLVHVRVSAVNSAGATVATSAAVGPVGGSSSSTSSTSAAASSSQLTLTSNLVSGQGFKTKWKSIPWTVTPSVPVSSVEFWIDGTLRWTDTSAPYKFGETGLLDLSALSSGSHTLLAKATALDGTTTSLSLIIIVK